MKMARVNIIVFTITVLWISNSVMDSVQQDSDHEKKHKGHIDMVLNDDHLAARDNGLSDSDGTVKPNIIDSRRKLRAGQLGPKHLGILGHIGVGIIGQVLDHLLGRNLEPMTMNANGYDDKMFSTYYGTPLKRGYWGWGKGPGFLPIVDLINELTDAMKGRLKKKHSVGSLSNLPIDAKYFG